ncbi:hypothetical protein [Neptuniibacter halophilus]|uniref:hypothetical protein n=1 Tax=Neptuniibacter halophilus TaxID=651666 RepID=UPI002574524D|nr:hypothetical protein [Neptuniibacter halophilus]
MAKRYPVTEKLRALSNRAQKIGCALVIQPHAFMPYSTHAIIPDTEAARHTLQLGLAEGAVLVLVDHCDMDKRAKNSRYYRALLQLEERFNERRAHLAQLVSDTDSHP